MTLVIFFNIFMILTLNSLNVVNTLNILGVFPLPTKSHFFVFSPYLKELANRGHNVSVISYFPQKEPMVNYYDIDLGETAKAMEISHPINKSFFMVFISTTIFQAFSGPLTCRILFENENVQNLWETHVHFDLVVVEQFNSDCGLALAHALGAPVIGITSHVLLPWHYNRFGVPYNPSYVPFDFLDAGTKPTFMQRLTRYFFYNQVNIIYTYVSQVIEQNIVQEFLSDTPPLSELAKDIKLVLVYQNFIFFGSSISPPNVIEVGGFHVAEPRPLPDDLKKFIEDSKYGVIYISFGTILKASSMPTDKLQSIINALNELPQRVIWKWNKKSLPGNPKNIYLAKWLPQNDILAHPKVMAFFSHCGLLGITEALYHGVPVIGMPIYGDQPTNAAAVEESGLGVQIQLDLITKEYLLDKFKIVLDPAFREKVRQLSKAWNDHPIKPMDKAIFWTEYAARYKNFTFRPPTVDVSLYQYLCLDTYSAILITMVATIITFRYIVIMLYKMFVRKQYDSPGAKKTKVKTN